VSPGKTDPSRIAKRTTRRWISAGWSEHYANAINKHAQIVGYVMGDATSPSSSNSR
jgi:hypothetical protein